MTNNDLLESGSTIRRTLWGMLMILITVFGLGFMTGVGMVMLEKGFSVARLLVFVLGGAATFAAGRNLVRTFNLLRAGPKSDYERRYEKMWLVMVILGIPLGMLMVLTADDYTPAELFMGSLTSTEAIVTAALFTVLLILGGLVFHRTVDDHEEQATLWGVLFAYYFLMIVGVAWWVLQRAALVPDMTIGIAMIGLFISMLIQGAVWLFIKYR